MNYAIGILIILLYFGNAHICYLVFPDNIDSWWDLNHSILSLIIILAVKYKAQNNVIEKLFNSMVLNNIYALLYKNETTYTINDLWFVVIFTIAQYIKIDKKDD